MKIKSYDEILQEATAYALKIMPGQSVQADVDRKLIILGYIHASTLLYGEISAYTTYFKRNG